MKKGPYKVIGNVGDLLIATTATGFVKLIKSGQGSLWLTQEVARRCLYYLRYLVVWERTLQRPLGRYGPSGILFSGTFAENKVIIAV